ncbi:TauD/TfdA family dioxygenase [Flavobacterium jejuense]|uniref:TauD/TfdA family dioxygenase n=1 Tax=Flavobacterium jejuense TaxID=1544455 RepID=A0ABX0IS46_9FLAO|nr:TauD/TfdA family dioxygenase [Flavobacterium jejuense]NHN25915.1 TauD/TfdA family dioxygenase [Flavobacterium jejuense]
MENLKEKLLLPLIKEVKELTRDEFISYYLKNKDEFDTDLKEYGAIKFKGVLIDSQETFQYIVNSISTKFLSYIDGNSPRTKLTDNVYTSTEYDKRQKITMHNELSYSAKWPNKLFFSCLQVAETGGETLLADSRSILRAMNPDIVSEIKTKGIIYVRNLNGGQFGMGPSWQDTFETDDKKQVEEYCTSYNINFKWMENDNLRVEQFSKGIIEHRTTKENIWFNQIDQFHPCHLGEEIFESMKILYDTPENFPMYVKFGDGTSISEDIVKEILSTIDKLTIAPKWQKNELLIVDNELIAHGRNSYSGDRRVIVAMSE